MATGHARLAGRFPPGSDVRLVEVDSEVALRSEGGREVDVQTVGEDGVVTFSKGVRVGGRYFVVGLVNGSPLEVRIRGNAAAEDDAVNAQAPVGPDRVRLADGSFADEAPAREKAPVVSPGPTLGQHQVPEGVVQRSDTPRGTAHPVDVEDQEPVRRQEDVPDGVVQMSDTETGEASEILVGPQRQEDVPERVVQRSATPTGVATPIPVGDSVEATRLAESSQARESRGDRTRAMAEPLEAKGAKVGAPTGSSQEKSPQRDAELKRSEREAGAAVPADQPADANVDTSGRDAEGQPVAEDVAAAAGVKPASKPAEASKSTARSEAAKKAAATRKRNASKSSASKSSSSGSSRKKS
jgi:hypothetical protein